MVLASMAAVPPASAQSPADSREYVESSERVRKLNDEAVSAIINEDYVRAISLLEESRALEESNILYLNLGRAYQKLGKCEKARQALEKVDDVPIVRDPPPDIINKKAQQYLAELEEQCPTTEKKTARAGATSEGEGGDEQQAEEEQLAEEKSQEKQVEEVAEPSGGESSSWRSTAGWVSLGTGVALIGGGVWMHFDAEARRDSIGGLDGSPASVSYREAQDIESTANTLDTIGLSMAVVGAVAGGFGTYFLVTDAPAEADSSRVSVQPHRGGASVTFSTHW